VPGVVPVTEYRGTENGGKKIRVEIQRIETKALALALKGGKGYQRS